MHKLTNTNKLVPIFFLLVGIFSNQLADLICRFWLDDLECTLQIACTIWDQAEYYVAHKFLSYLLYYVGLYGFTGGILWLIEEYLVGKYFSKTLNAIASIFSYTLAFFIGVLVTNFFSSILGLDWIFEILYKYFN